MITAATAGILLGLSAGLSPGPLFALVLTQTLQHGVREGLKVAVAPFITDVPIIVLSLAVLAHLSGFERVLGALSLGGGLYILYLAWESARVGPVDLTQPQGEAQSLRKGVLVNALNPHPYMFWITVGAPFLLKSRQSHVLAPALFLVFFYVCLVGSKVVLALVTGRSRALLSGRGYVYVMRVLSGLLALFAVLLFKDALELLGFFAA